MANYLPRRIDLTGQRFGRLLVITYAETRNAQTKTARAYWRCRCDCGQTTIVAAGNLKNKSVISCGCKQRENRVRQGKANATHGHTRGVKNGKKSSRTYRSWMSMKQRCHDKNHTFFHHYGGRGIKICKRWLRFENFLADMGKRPIRKSLDRINPNGNYTPSNCRWATPLDQRHNRRKK
jgi:hypothetical protein